MQKLSSTSPDAALKDDKNFLEILHQLLDEHSCDERGGPRVISWNADGLSFQIHDAESFERRLLPAYYATSSTNVATYKAFLARLKAYGFYRVSNEGIYKDTCSHPLFVKGNRSHLSRMSRRQSFQGKDSWPMPRVMERRASCGGGAGGVVRRNSAIAQRRRSALSRPVRTIADMKRTACVRRRKSSSPVTSSRGRRLSLKDTLLQRRRHHNHHDDQQQQQQQQQKQQQPQQQQKQRPQCQPQQQRGLSNSTLSSSTQNALLEMLRDLPFDSDEEEENLKNLQLPPKSFSAFHDDETEPSPSRSTDIEPLDYMSPTEDFELSHDDIADLLGEL